MPEQYERYRLARQDGARPCELYNPVTCDYLPDRFATFLARLPPEVEAPAVHVFENVVVAGQGRQACLYDSDGRLLSLSRVPARNANEPPSATGLDFGADALETIEEPVLFQSVFFWHWGHFLLESCARSWAAIADPALAELPWLFAWPVSLHFAGGAYSDYLAAAGARLRYRKPGATRLARCYVPTVSFAVRAFAHELHLAMAHRVAQRLLEHAPRDERPVYLSRSQLGAGGAARKPILNESELEQRLAERGVRIVHMQSMSLAAQIEVMNAHRVFIGPWGSALHNMVFSLHGREITTFVLTENFCPDNCLLLDGIVGNAAHYLFVLQPPAEGDVDSLEVDVDAALGYLQESGIF